ncbi:MAG: hypothetical protein IT382_10310 [Deltaproteobacteria bacterium]|nr:hypothetical protein [Deltaproteobacteria bacterium]
MKTIAMWLLGAALCACEPPWEAPPPDEPPPDPPQEPADPVQCGPDTALFSFTDLVDTELDTRELSAVITETAGEVTLEFDDAGSVRFLVDDGVPPILPQPGPVRFYPWAADCWGEGCDPTFHTLENDELGEFLELGMMRMLDGYPMAFGPVGVPLSLRFGLDTDVCPDGGGEVPAVLQVAADEGVVEVLPGQALDVVVLGQPWRVKAGAARRTEFLWTNEDCDDCPSPGLHQETTSSALLYRR